jgi:hypothetical protein
MALNMKSILEKFDSEELKKLDGIKNSEFFEFLEFYVELLNPSKYLSFQIKRDFDFVRKRHSRW